jgi:hypothetical protein
VHNDSSQLTHQLTDFFESKGAKRSQSFIDSFQLIEQVSETVNEFTKDRREHIDSIDDEIKLVKEKITIWVSVGFLDISIRW